jgi:hypothetical protein
MTTTSFEDLVSQLDQYLQSCDGQLHCYRSRSSLVVTSNHIVGHVVRTTAGEKRPLTLNIMVRTWTISRGHKEGKNEAFWEE